MRDLILSFVLSFGVALADTDEALVSLGMLALHEDADDEDEDENDIEDDEDVDDELDNGEIISSFMLIDLN